MLVQPSLDLPNNITLDTAHAWVMGNTLAKLYLNSVPDSWEYTNYTTLLSLFSHKCMSLRDLDSLDQPRMLLSRIDALS